MEDIVAVAKYISEAYKDMYGEDIGQTKLQKLLYFAQRENLALTDSPLFDDAMEGWRYGPVSRRVYSMNGHYPPETGAISSEAKYIVNNVLCGYGGMLASQLRDLSHEEKSWQRARAGLTDDQDGNTPLQLNDIRDDAKKVRPYDYVWDMYYDEFETAEGR